MKKGKALAAFGLTAAMLVTGLIAPAYGQQSTDEGQRELAGNQVTPSQGIAKQLGFCGLKRRITDR